MKKNLVNENAAQRKTYVGFIFDEGENCRKKEVLRKLPAEWASMHNSGYIHIHDLDAYGLTYNCLTFDILGKFPYDRYEKLDDFQKITGVFEFIKQLIAKVANEQSGGMGFANFDIDLAFIFKNLNVNLNEINQKLIYASIYNLILWCTDSHERMGQVSYYVTLNIGLADDEYSRFICRSVLDAFRDSPSRTVRPNIVFKVKSGINRCMKDPNHDLLERSLLCSAKKMIPTYLLCDCELDNGYDPLKISVMGCRTRVVDDIYGATGSVGRGNIANISINLPRIAMDVMNERKSVDFEDDIEMFKVKWRKIAGVVTDILIDRYEKIVKHHGKDYPTVSHYQLWIEDFGEDSLSQNVFRHGTLSVGFIGLSEAMEILSGHRYYQNNIVMDAALDFVKYMRSFVDECKSVYNLNFSLLATSGEQISGRFEELDLKAYPSQVIEKGYYTNSFHVNVDSDLTCFEKLSVEGPFHKYCNGGCISYVEIDGSPIGNSEALMELIECGIQAGVHYLGFNFKLDVCNKCDNSGIFDCCDKCGSNNITHIRRVSGYLEDTHYFTKGKKCEVRDRKRN